MPRNAPPRARREPSTAAEPFDLARRVITGLMVGATVISMLLAVTGLVPRAWVLAGALWALYGLVAGLGGFVGPATDAAVRMLTDVGQGGGTRGFSEIEALEARGEHAFAAERYRERAEKDPRARTAATVRRAALLAGPLADPSRAAAELIALRDEAGDRLSPSDDILIGTTLAHFYEYRLADPGKAMRELRRLLDRHPSSSRTRYLRRSLAALRDARFDRAPGAGAPGSAM